MREQSEDCDYVVCHPFRVQIVLFFFYNNFIPSGFIACLLYKVKKRIYKLKNAFIFRMIGGVVEEGFTHFYSPSIFNISLYNDSEILKFAS
jgi:hypothetical protein